MEDKDLTEIRCDVLIVGASLGGVAAAMGACDLGASVCLVDSDTWVGGQVSSQGVCTLDETVLIEPAGSTKSYLEFRNRIRAHYADNYALSDEARKNLARLHPGNCWVGMMSVEPKRARHLLMEELNARPSIRLVLGAQIGQPQFEGDAVKSLSVLDAKGDPLLFLPQYILDATDLGDMLERLNVEHVIGTESKHDTQEPDGDEEGHPGFIQPFTFPFILELRPSGENHTIPRPATYDEIKRQQKYSTIDGNEIKTTFGDHSWWTYRRVIDKDNFADAAFPTDLSSINMDANDFKGGVIPSGNSDFDERLKEQGRQTSLGYVYYLQTECPRDDGGPPGYPELLLRTDAFDTQDGIARQPYIRESRRIRALQRIVEQDIVRKVQPGPRAAFFEDSCGIGYYRADVHRGPTDDVGMNLDTWPFQIPLGALVPIRVTNVLPACKNIGTTHITNGAYRVHPVEWSIGEAAGALAAHCVRNSVTPRQVRTDPDAFQRVLTSQGIPLFWWSDVPPEHPAFRAAQFLAMKHIFEGQALQLDADGHPDLRFRPDDTLTDEESNALHDRIGKEFTWPVSPIARADAAVFLAATFFDVT